MGTTQPWSRPDMDQGIKTAAALDTSGDTQSVDQSFDRISQIVSSEGRENTRFADNPFACAVERVLTEFGAAMPSDPAIIDRLRTATSIENVCNIVRARSRSVNLGPRWWKVDHGHLIGYLKVNGDASSDDVSSVPVALISSSAGTYRMYRSDTGQSALVTAMQAEALQTDALEVSPPLPAGLARIRDLARFMLPLIRHELKWTAVNWRLHWPIGRVASSCDSGCDRHGHPRRRKEFVA